jgi:hypothetical protein
VDVGHAELERQNLWRSGLCHHGALQHQQQNQRETASPALPEPIEHHPSPVIDLNPLYKPM